MKRRNSTSADPGIGSCFQSWSGQERPGKETRPRELGIIPSGGLTLVGYILENSGFIDRLNENPNPPAMLGRIE